MSSAGADLAAHYADPRGGEKRWIFTAEARVHMEVGLVAATVLGSERRQCTVEVNTIEDKRVPCALTPNHISNFLKFNYS